MRVPSVKCLVHARIPTSVGDFHLAYYANTLDEKEHLALTHGDVNGREAVLVRVHSECFTGDVVGSLRCDCGAQLAAALRLIAEEGAGVVLYLRQEGRGIGLFHKLQAYNLQDEGHDTVEANLLLGHGADERDYTVAALMLQDLGVRSARLITNNPAKIEALERLSLPVVERVPSRPHVTRQNAAYLQTKVARMRHLLDLGPLQGPPAGGTPAGRPGFDAQVDDHVRRHRRPFVTLSYAQSLDGSIAAVPGRPLALSGPEALTFTHGLRAAHDAILIGINTLLADDPRLTVRRVPGAHPRPVVVDTYLRTPLTARLLTRPGPAPLIAAGAEADPARQTALERAGAQVLRLPTDATGCVALPALLEALGRRNLRSVMVEGGARIITSFLTHHLVDHVAITMTNRFVGGLRAVGSLQRPAEHGTLLRMPADAFPRLQNLRYQWLGEDLILEGDPFWGDPFWSD